MGQERKLSSKYYWHSNANFRRKNFYVTLTVMVYAKFYNDQSQEGPSVPQVTQRNDITTEQCKKKTNKSNNDDRNDCW